MLRLCAECLRTPDRRPWHHAVSVYPFRGPIRQVIHRFKYHGHTALGPFLGQQMAQAWEQYGSGTPDCAVPVPLHWAKKILRGYNQSEILAWQICRETGIPLRHLLRRRKWTGQQAKMDFKERQRNMSEVFCLRKKAKPVGLHILVLDDVLTTGATLAAVTECLKQGGANRVSVLTIARG
jgi:ComF family protein